MMMKVNGNGTRTDQLAFTLFLIRLVFVTAQSLDVPLDSQVARV